MTPPSARPPPRNCDASNDGEGEAEDDAGLSGSGREDICSPCEQIEKGRRGELDAAHDIGLRREQGHLEMVVGGLVGCIGGADEDGETREVRRERRRSASKTRRIGIVGIVPAGP